MLSASVLMLCGSTFDWISIGPKLLLHIVFQVESRFVNVATTDWTDLFVLVQFRVTDGTAPLLLLVLGH